MRKNIGLSEAEWEAVEASSLRIEAFDGASHVQIDRLVDEESKVLPSGSAVVLIRFAPPIGTEGDRGAERSSHTDASGDA
jgi:hypothetical protein